jgi:hypothetical protein
MTDELPADEHARALDERQKRIEKAKAEDARHHKPPIFDGLGQVVPDHLRDLFASTALSDLANQLRAKAEEIDSRCDADVSELRSLFQRARSLEKAGYRHVGIGAAVRDATEAIKLKRKAAEELRKAAEALERGIPYAICAWCKGDIRAIDDCMHCLSAGCVPKWRYHAQWRDHEKPDNEEAAECRDRGDLDDEYVEYGDDE